MVMCMQPSQQGPLNPLKTFQASSCKDYDDNDRDMRRMMMKSA